MIPRESAKEDVHSLQYFRAIPSSAPTGSIYTNHSTYKFDIPKDIHEIVAGTLEQDITNNHAVAATTAVWTLSAKLADQTTDGTADGGVFVIGFPALGVSTTPQVYNVTAAALQTAIRALHPALAAVTVGGGTFATPAPYTVTMTHTADEFPLEGTEVKITGGVLDGAVICTLSSYPTTTYATGGSLKMTAVPLHLKEVVTRANELQLEKIEGDNVLDKIRSHSTPEELKTNGRRIGFDFEKKQSWNWINGGGGTLSVYCPLPNALFDQGQIVPCIHNKTNFSVEITLNTGAVLLDPTSGSTATTANLQYAAAYLWIAYKRYTPEMIATKRAEAMAGPHAYQIWESKQTSIHDWSTLTAGTEVSEYLGLHGEVSDLVLSLRPSTPTSAQSHMYPLKLNSLKVQDGHGQPILGSDYVTHKVMRDIILPETYPWVDRSIFENFNTYVFTPSSDVRSAKYNGQVVGLYPLVGDERVYVTPTAASSDQVQLRCYYTVRRFLEINPDGSVRFLN